MLIRAPFRDKGARQFLELHSSLYHPGFSNHVGRMVIVKDESKEMPKMLQQFTLTLPTCVNHMMMTAILHQDALFLNGQERALTHKGTYRTAQPIGVTDSYSRASFLNFANRETMLFGSWMGKFFGGFVPLTDNTMMPPAENEVMIDVWNSNTKYCEYQVL